MDKTKKRVLVCGTGFGKVYLNAVSKSEKYQISGILASGSERSKHLASQLHVPLLTKVDELNEIPDIACVVIPNAAGGGKGADIAVSLLQRGIPTLLEHPVHEKEIVRCIRASGNTSFYINPFYRHIAPIAEFLLAADYLNKQSKLLNAHLSCSIHVLYSGIDILGCALGGLHPLVSDSSNAITSDLTESGSKHILGDGIVSLKVILSGKPITMSINTEVDRNDPDHPLHLYHRLILTYSCGTLSLTNTHGPIVWHPFLRIPRSQSGLIDTKFQDSEAQIPSSFVLGDAQGPSINQTLNTVWPEGIIKSLNKLAQQTPDEKRQNVQIQLLVSQIWSKISKRVNYSKFVEYDKQSPIETISNYLEGRKYL